MKEAYTERRVQPNGTSLLVQRSRRVSKYEPHQGKQECARRKRRLERCQK